MLVLAPSPAASDELLRLAATGPGAAFGWHRATPARLAAAVAGVELAAEGLAPVGRLAAVAVVARVVQQLAEEGRLGRYATVARGPSFARAVATVLEELRLAETSQGAIEEMDEGLAALARAYDAALLEAGLIDRPGVLRRAAARIADPAFAHPLLDRPTLALDLPVPNAVEGGLLAAVAGRAPELLVTVAAGDASSEHFWEEAAGDAKVEDGALAPHGSLEKLQVHLFEDHAPEPAPLDEDVDVLSAPGESRECVEIARRLQAWAREGIPFDRMAVLVRSVGEYRAHLDEALARADVPAWFARGATRPDPAGRAFFALLACRAEDFSARRFAEYLSLGEVPAAVDGAPPPAAPAGDRWVAPDEELLPEGVAEVLSLAHLPEPAEGPAGNDPERDPVTEGSLRAPWRWEDLLVEAAVIGGRERWERRLDGLAGKLAPTADDDPDDPRQRGRARARDDLDALRGFALPLLDALAELPQSASWGEWLDVLSALATRALRRPERVLAVLAELSPMSAVGPVELPAVQRVLGERLLELEEPPVASRQGRVFVGPADAVRGLCFDAVCVPGLAERLFPRKISEEPLLLDTRRRRLGGLPTNEDRVFAERMALRLAVGAARRRLVLSYPRLDLEQSRPRVPSFYALEALRAAEGELPGFDSLAARAEEVAAARVGWPAPDDPAEAIDEAEHDLALLERLLGQREEESAGTARYLLGANPHLGRALRFRARRWLPRWTQADGLAPPVEGEMPAAAGQAIAAHRLAARSFSPTALQHFASCPYRFFLQAVHRLAPREEPEPIDELEPRERGSLVHDVQFELFTRLETEGLLPLGSARLDSAREILEQVIEDVAAEKREMLAPAIERVWLDGITSVKADLREWLRRLAADDSGFVPWAFELAFGPVPRGERDRRSQDDPVELDCGIQLRGSIDLVERRLDGRLRVTDHKTGKVRVDPSGVIAGGESLQPVLYALAAEKMEPEAQVESGRLYYCTAAGGFEEREVALDGDAREAAERVARVVDGGLEEPFLVAAPVKNGCRFCDYRRVCGPYEELRTSRKHWAHPRMRALSELRGTR